MSKTHHGIEFRKPSQAARRFRNQMRILMKHLRYNMPFPFRAFLHSIWNEHCTIGFHNGNIPYASAFVCKEDGVIKIEMRWRTEMQPYFEGLHKNGTLYPDGLYKDHKVELVDSDGWKTDDPRAILVGMAKTTKEWLALLPQLTRSQGLQPCGLSYLPIIDGFAQLKTFVIGTVQHQFGPWMFDWSKPIIFENCRQWSYEFYAPKQEVLKQQHGYSILPYLVGRTISINGQNHTIKRTGTNFSGEAILGI